MKNFALIAIITCSLAGVCNAKYVPYQKDWSDKAIEEFRSLDKNNDGKLTKSEYGAKSKRKLSRSQKRIIRKAQKEGRYKSNDEQFDQIIQIKSSDFVDQATQAAYEPKPQSRMEERDLRNSKKRGTYQEYNPNQESKEETINLEQFMKYMKQIEESDEGRNAYY